MAARRGRESKGESKGERERESETQREREITSESEREYLCWGLPDKMRLSRCAFETPISGSCLSPDRREARRVVRSPTHRLTPCVTVCYSVLQVAAANSQAHSVCYSVLQCVAGRGRQLTISPLTTAYPTERTCTVSQSYRLGVCFQVVYFGNCPVWTSLTLVPAYV